MAKVFTLKSNRELINKAILNENFDYVCEILSEINNIGFNGNIEDILVIGRICFTATGNDIYLPEKVNKTIDEHLSIFYSSIHPDPVIESKLEAEIEECLC